MRKLNDGYSIEVDSFDEKAWNDIINQFTDANIYQTWAYGEIRSGRKNMSHLVLKRENNVVAAAQVRLLRIPLLNAGIAYAFWGPLWQLKNEEPDEQILIQMLRAMRNEYSHKRRYVLRVYPMIYNDDKMNYISMMEEEGFQTLKEINKSRTLIINLSSTKEELRKGLAQKWRNSLNKAEKNNMELIEGTTDELFQIFIDIYKDMLKRKNFVEPNDINEFRRIQMRLPEEFKMKIMLCRYEGELSAGSIFSALGNTGLYLFGATNDAGMKSNGSYLMQWKYIEWLKNSNYAFYDLNGINPDANPGTYKFKEGLCGKNGQDVHFIGQYQTCDNIISKLIVELGEKAVKHYKHGRALFRNRTN